MKMYDCGFSKESNWFRYRVGAIIIENDWEKRMPEPVT